MVNTNPEKIMNRILGNAMQTTARKKPARRRMRQNNDENYFIVITSKNIEELFKLWGFENLSEVPAYYGKLSLEFYGNLFHINNEIYNFKNNILKFKDDFLTIKEALKTKKLVSYIHGDRIMETKVKEYVDNLGI